MKESSYFGILKSRSCQLLPQLLLSLFLVNWLLSVLFFFALYSVSVIFLSLLLNTAFSNLLAYSQCNAQQRNSKSLDSKPWAKDSDPLHMGSWASRIACPLHSIWKQTAANGANGGLNPSEPSRHTVAPAARAPQTKLCHNQAMGALKRNCCNISPLSSL